MLLDRKELLVALRLLDEELGTAGVRGEVFVVGGAAMALAYDARRATVDVDAIFVPAAEVRQAAARVAERLQIEGDWLNDGAKAFMPGSDPERIGVFEGDRLSVAAASPRYLLAMKRWRPESSVIRMTSDSSTTCVVSPPPRKAWT